MVGREMGWGGRWVWDGHGLGRDTGCMRDMAGANYGRDTHC